MTFGDSLKSLRKQAGMTQTELAKRAGVTERSVYNYEKNSRAPKIDIVEKFAQVLNVSTEKLLGSYADKTAKPMDSDTLDKVLLQVELIFGSNSLSDFQKERFFQQVAMAYFDFKNKGEDE